MIFLSGLFRLSFNRVWLKIFLMVMTTISSLSAEKRSMLFKATHGYFSGLGMGCALDILRHNKTTAVFDNQTGTCNLQPDSNLTTETSTHISLIVYEPLFEAAKEVRVVGNSAVDPRWPIVVDIRIINPGEGDQFLTEFFQNEEVMIAFKVLFEEMTMSLQMFNTSDWTRPESYPNIFAFQDNYTRLTFNFVGNNLEVYFGDDPVYKYEDLGGFQSNRTVRYLSNLSYCYRISFGLMASLSE